MKPAGAPAVRRMIARAQPLLTLHGHIHESPGHVRLGRTLTINDGSEYAEGIMTAAISNLEFGRVKGHIWIPGWVDGQPGRTPPRLLRRAQPHPAGSRAAREPPRRGAPDRRPGVPHPLPAVRAPAAGARSGGHRHRLRLLPAVLPRPAAPVSHPRPPRRHDGLAPVRREPHALPRPGLRPPRRRLLRPPSLLPPQPARWRAHPRGPGRASTKTP